MPTPTRNPQPGATTTDDGQQQETDYKSLYEKLTTEFEAFKSEAERRYTGLQTSMNKKEEGFRTKEAAFEETQKQLAAKSDELTKALASMQELQGKLDETTIISDGAQAKLNRANLIFSKYPELATFEANGLLPETGPDDGEDKLDGLFGAFQKQLGLVRQSAVQSHVQGSVPASIPTSAGVTSSPVPTDREALLRASTDALLKGDKTEYDRLYNLYIQSPEKKA